MIFSDERWKQVTLGCFLLTALGLGLRHQLVGLRKSIHLILTRKSILITFSQIIILLLHKLWKRCTFHNWPINNIIIICCLLHIHGYPLFLWLHFLRQFRSMITLIKLGWRIDLVFRKSFLSMFLSESSVTNFHSRALSNSASWSRGQVIGDATWGERHRDQFNVGARDRSFSDFRFWKSEWVRSRLLRPRFLICFNLDLWASVDVGSPHFCIHCNRLAIFGTLRTFKTALCLVWQHRMTLLIAIRLCFIKKISKFH